MSELINGRTPEEIKAALCVCTSAEACNLYGCYYSADNDCRTTLMRDALALIERLESERDAALAKVPKWISVEERSEPPQDGEYWCFGYWIGSGRKQAGTAEYFGEWKISNNFVLTHWMLNPEPPKEGE